MTKKGTILFIMLLAALAARAFDFSAATTAGQTLYYNITSATTVMVVNPDWDNHAQPQGFLALPATVEHGGTIYRLTAIDVEAFLSCESLTGVSIPEGVNRIGRMAFAFCSTLDSIVLPTTLTQIGAMAFTGTSFYSNNDNINAEGLMFIGPYLIAARSNITTAIVVPEGTLGLGNMAFYSCEHLPDVTLPSTLRFIGENAFNNCQSLDTLRMLGYLPPSLESNAFLDVPDFVVTVPCGAKNTYLAATNWSALTIISICRFTPCPADFPPHPHPPIVVGIDDVEVTPMTAVSVEGGLLVTMPDGYGCIVRDMLGRLVATLRNSGFVPLKTPGLYLVSSPLSGKTIKVIFNN